MSEPLLNWSRTVEFTSRQLIRPTSIEQLQEAVAAADRIRALGSRHSFSRIADTVGTLVSVADLALPLELDEASRTVVVPGGMTYAQVTAFLQEHGWALHNLGSLPHISVAGACATGTHGSGRGNRCLATAATRIEFVRGDGELISRTAEDPDFGGSVLALGALGVVTRIGLSIEPSYDMTQEVWLDLSLEQFLTNFDAVMSGGYSVSAFTDWSTPGSIDAVWVKSRTDRPAGPDLAALGARRAPGPQHPLRGEDARSATDQTGQPGPWLTRLPHFRAEFTPSSGAEQQTEYMVALSDGPAAVRALGSVDFGGALQVCEFRTIAADDLWLSPFNQRDSVALHFTWHKDDALVNRAVAEVEAALDGFDYRPHWGKVFGERAAADIRRHYPRLAQFQGLAAEHDPERTFGNDFLARHVYG